MPITIEKNIPQTIKPKILPQKDKTQANNKTEPAKKESDTKNKLLLALCGLAVIAGAIYLSRGRSTNASKKASKTLSSDANPAGNTNGLQKNAGHLPEISKEEQELTSVLKREENKCAEIIKTMQTPEKIPTLPENKTNLNGIYKTTENDKTTYHLYKNGEAQGTILTEAEGYLLKMDDKNSVFIWEDGSGIYYEVANKEAIPAEIIKNLNENCTSQEFGSLELTNYLGEKNKQTIGLHPLRNGENQMGLFFTFPAT